jgi:CubicO group peptidase (beta-lactamase class C family)
MPRSQFLPIYLGLLSVALQGADDQRFPGADWEHVTKPEAVGFSGPKLALLGNWMKTLDTTAIVVVVGGRILFEYGDVKHVSVLASARKSVLGMLYGKYVGNGTIDLDRTVKDVGLDDVQKFLPIEQGARLQDLLMARSGIYLPSDGDEGPSDMCPARGSQFPGAFFCYTNWDFNAAGTAFEKLTGKNIYDALESDLAHPIGLQDFDRAVQKKDTAMPHSVHPLYHIYLSTRDMARVGLLMLRGGNWNGKQVVDQNWVNFMTTLVTPVNELFPHGLRQAAEQAQWRWGFGTMWWVWDSPRLPIGLSANSFYGAYSAMGFGGQYITVLPGYDMVVAHKVEIQNTSRGMDVSNQDYYTVLQMLIASRCGDHCH